MWGIVILKYTNLEPQKNDSIEIVQKDEAKKTALNIDSQNSEIIDKATYTLFVKQDI